MIGPNTVQHFIKPHAPAIMEDTSGSCLRSSHGEASAGITSNIRLQLLNRGGLG